MELSRGFQIEEPRIFVPWDIGEEAFQKIFPELHFCFPLPNGAERLPLAFFVAELWALIFAGVRMAFSGLFQPRLQPRV